MHSVVRTSLSSWKVSLFNILNRSFWCFFSLFFYKRTFKNVLIEVFGHEVVLVGQFTYTTAFVCRLNSNKLPQIRLCRVKIKYYTVYSAAKFTSL